ncbi:MAG: leucine-rich repeat domain-containing protein [Oscillospiraceae bacterium]|jgi:hypothetical protein|nr:leucine-rich repeat domain-containing protein [Oscillospiraceae bacterium]
MRRFTSKKKDFELKLEQEFPFMRRSEVTDEQWEKGGYSTYAAYGCECQGGWYGILRGLCLDITNAFEKNGQTVDLTIAQIKEKFGTLRFYYSIGDEDPGIHAFDFLGSGTSLRLSPGRTEFQREIRDIVSKWEKESASVCEKCGVAGQVRGDLGWIRTMCNDCYVKALEAKKEYDRIHEERKANPERIKQEEEEELAEIRRKTFSLKNVEDAVNVECITIPGWVRHINDDVFDACVRLKHINAEPSNTDPEGYVSFDGVLFKNVIHSSVSDEKCLRRRLVRYPREKEQNDYSIPDGVKRISSDAFKSCTNLKTVNVPKSVTDIAFDIFGGSSLENITVDSENRYFTDVGGVLYSKYMTELYAYPPEKDSAYFDIPDGVRKIWHNAFKNTRKFVSINIPDSVGFIGNDAFEGCLSLKGITLPKAWFNDDQRVFYNCPCLEYINVATEDKVFFAGDKYNSFDGVLFCGPTKYSKGSPRDGKMKEYIKHILMRYPEAKQQEVYTVPDGVTKILTYAFSGQAHLKSITIPKSVTEIGEGAFEGCRSELTLRCHKGSCAHEYALDKGIKYEAMEDS